MMSVFQVDCQIYEISMEIGKTFLKALMPIIYIVRESKWSGSRTTK